MPVPLGLLAEAVGVQSIARIAGMALLGAASGSCAHLPLPTTPPVDRGPAAAGAGAGADDGTGAVGYLHDIGLLQEQLHRVARCPGKHCGRLCLFPPEVDSPDNGWDRLEGKCPHADCEVKSWCIKCGWQGEKMHPGLCNAAKLW